MLLALAPTAAAQTGSDPTVPPATVLYHNFPNPFPAGTEDRTCIWFDLAKAGRVELDILDMRGNTVRRLLPSPDFPAGLLPGRYGRGAPGGPPCDPRFSWDGTAERGTPVPEGLYLVRLRTAGETSFRRIVFRGRGR